MQSQRLLGASGRLLRAVPVCLLLLSAAFQLAHAQVIERPFTVSASFDQPGEIIQIGNALMTRDDAEADCLERKSRIGPAFSLSTVTYAHYIALKD